MACNFEQTLFLGCTIRDFSTNLGWGGQPSQLTVNLVEDDDSHEKKYWNIAASNQIQTWNAPDPGFESFGNGSEAPKVGNPVYFRFGDFEFCGIIQDYQRTNPQACKKEWTVVIESPNQLLEGCEVITSDYSGPVAGFNIFNVYGFMEIWGGINAFTYTDENALIDGVIMGSEAGAFGGADVNEGGMPWLKVKDGMSILTSSFIPANSLGYGAFSEYGRIVGRGSPNNANFGLLPSDDVNVEIAGLFGVSSNICYYYLDLSDVPVAANDFRIAGETSSIMDIVSEVCSTFGHDFYVELVPVIFGGSIIKIIKIRTVSRITQPEVGRIQNYVENIDNVISSSYGREFRNEATTGILVGSNKQNIFQVLAGTPDPEDDPDESWLQTNYGSNTYVRERIVPFFGTDTSGNVYVLQEDGDGEFLNIDFSELKTRLNLLGSAIANSNKIYINELQIAASGFDAWLAYIGSAGTPLFSGLEQSGFNINVGIFKLENIKMWVERAIDAGENIADIGLRARDIMNARINSNLENPQVVQELELIHEFIAAIYDTYMNYIMIRLPYVGGFYSDGQRRLTDEVADGGWTDAATVLNLANPGGLLDVMRNEDGTIAPFGYVKYRPDTENEDFVDNDKLKVFVEATEDSVDYKYLYFDLAQEQDIAFLDNTNLRNPRIIAKRPQIEERQELERRFAGLDKFAQLFPIFPDLGQALKGKLNDDTESALLSLGSEATPIIPDAAAVALRSTQNSYGPWYPDNVVQAGPPGRTDVIRNDGINPWSYGGYANMNTVAQAHVNATVAEMQEAERGSVKVAGIPSIPLGSELASLKSLNTAYYSNNEHLVENRTVAYINNSLTNPNGQNTQFNSVYMNYGGAWSGSFGPTVTSINVNISTNGLDTTYNFRTYSPNFGKLRKENADRLGQRLNSQYLKIRQNRIFNSLRQFQNKNLENFKRDNKRKAKRAELGTPHSVLVGDISYWNSSTGNNPANSGVFSRTIVASKPLTELYQDINESGNFDSKAIVSWDALFRPISLEGDGGLPRMAQITGTTPPEFSIGNFTNHYLNPFFNPSGQELGQMGELHTGVSGHDIDIIARGTLGSFNESGNSLIMPVDKDGYDTAQRADYTNDYRPMALRGPLMIHGWGYDIGGKPIPNEVDDLENLVVGDFSDSDLEDRFFPDFGRKPQTWPVAPLDVRYNHQRGVWQAPIQDNVQYAIVIDRCDEATYVGDHLDGSFNLLTGIGGSCILLESVNPTGLSYEMPTTGVGETWADYSLVLANLYDEVPLETGRIIKIHRTDGSRVPSGPYASGSDITVIGEYIRITDYLRGLNGWDTNNDIILYHGSGGNETIAWGGEECATG